MSTERVVTIRMKKEDLAAWLSALRSGEYKQGVSRLETNGRYCCLGVLQHCLTGSVECHSHGPSLSIPSREWVDARGIEFTDDVGSKWRNAYLPSLKSTASNANDSGVYSFKDIADAIEACAEGY